VAHADDKTLAIFFLEKSQHPASIETQPNDLINNNAGSIPASTNLLLLLLFYIPSSRVHLLV